jgi:hypothetical protein
MHCSKNRAAGVRQNTYQYSPVVTFSICSESQPRRSSRGQCRMSWPLTISRSKTTSSACSRPVLITGYESPASCPYREPPLHRPKHTTGSEGLPAPPRCPGSSQSSFGRCGSRDEPSQDPYEQNTPALVLGMASMKTPGALVSHVVQVGLYGVDVALDIVQLSFGSPAEEAKPSRGFSLGFEQPGSLSVVGLSMGHPWPFGPLTGEENLRPGSSGVLFGL